MLNLATDEPCCRYNPPVSIVQRAEKVTWEYIQRAESKLDNVLSKARFGQKGILFFLIIENTHSS